MFSFKGITSQSMGLRVLNEINFNAPERDRNLIQIPGRDGNLIVDNGRFDDVLLTILCRLEVAGRQNVEQATSKINNWLSTDVGYHQFLWHNDPEFEYLARIESGTTTTRRLSQLANTMVNFSLHPIKYLRTSMIEREIDNGNILVNSLSMEAKPLIRILGNGPIRLTVGNQFVDINIPNDAKGCKIDTTNQMITILDGNQSLSRQMSGEFPKLISGNNPISWAGNSDFQVFITPRLGALV